MKAVSAKKKYFKRFRIIDRCTTFNGALQNALAVPEEYDDKKHSEALAILGQEPDDDLTCVYCGSAAATWDHLENNVRDGRFSGFGHRIYNLVPACRTCNERKGSKHWKDWLTKLDPEDKATKKKVLAVFAAKNDAERFGWDQIEKQFNELAKEYDQLREEIRTKLKEADVVAAKIREAISARLGLPAPAPGPRAKPGRKKPKR